MPARIGRRASPVAYLAPSHPPPFPSGSGPRRRPHTQSSSPDIFPAAGSGCLAVLYGAAGAAILRRSLSMSDPAASAFVCILSSFGRCRPCPSVVTGPPPRPGGRTRTAPAGLRGIIRFFMASYTIRIPRRVASVSVRPGSGARPDGHGRDPPACPAAYIHYQVIRIVHYWQRNNLTHPRSPASPGCVSRDRAPTPSRETHPGDASPVPYVRGPPCPFPSGLACVGASAAPGPLPRPRGRTDTGGLSASMHPPPGIAAFLSLANQHTSHPAVRRRQGVSGLSIKKAGSPDTPWRRLRSSIRSGPTHPVSLRSPPVPIRPPEQGPFPVPADGLALSAWPCLQRPFPYATFLPVKRYPYVFS